MRLTLVVWLSFVVRSSRTCTTGTPTGTLALHRPALYTVLLAPPFHRLVQATHVCVTSPTPETVVSCALTVLTSSAAAGLATSRARDRAPSALLRNRASMVRWPVEVVGRRWSKGWTTRERLWVVSGHGIANASVPGSVSCDVARGRHVVVAPMTHSVPQHSVSNGQQQDTVCIERLPRSCPSRSSRLNECIRLT